MTTIFNTLGLIIRMILVILPAMFALFAPDSFIAAIFWIIASAMVMLDGSTG